MQRFESLYMNTLVCRALEISKLLEIILCPSNIQFLATQLITE